MRRVVLCALLLMIAMRSGPSAGHEASTVQPSQGCESAPADAVLELPAPAGYWARIICTDTGHTLAPIDGDAWQIHEDSRWTGIPASGGALGGPNDWYYVAAAVRESTGADGTWAQGLFARRAGFPLPAEIRETYAVDLVDNRGNLIRIYVFLDASGPIAGIACVRSCSNTITMTVLHPEGAD